MQQHLELEGQIGGYEAADQQHEAVQDFYTSVAELLHTHPRNIAFASSATDAYARVLSAIPWQEGDTILTTENDYVSNQIAFLALQKRFGVQLLRARDTAAGGVDVDDFEQQLQQYKPRLAAVTHVPTNSGLVQPVEAIGRLCRNSDTLYLVDACQSAGQMPLDVAAIGCDFLSATMRKFLRGPRGAGFLYVSDRALDAGLELLIPDMRSADWTGADSYQAAPGARRYEYWEMPTALVLGSSAAAKYAQQVGLPWIQQRVHALATLSRDVLSEIPGVQVLDHGAQLCGIVTAHAPHWNGSRIVAALADHNINCRASTLAVAQIDFSRKGVSWALRVSPHYYNTEEEIRQLGEVLRQVFPR
jgi:selenocysteine lyase/cysteine desulfurase